MPWSVQTKKVDAYVLIDLHQACQAAANISFEGCHRNPHGWLQGMPAEYEQYLEDPAYAIINVPPNFMFKAKIFKPSRLCAIFKAV